MAEEFKNVTKENLVYYDSKLKQHISNSIPDSLPASDVYDWAKQPKKPAYTYSEVGAEKSGSVASHNSSTTAHSDIRSLISTVEDSLVSSVSKKSQIQMGTPNSGLSFVPTLKIHRMTQAEYESAVANGTIEENSLYLTPDEPIDLSGYATKSEVNSHKNDTSVHVTAEQKDNWDATYNKWKNHNYYSYIGFGNLATTNQVAGAPTEGTPKYVIKTVSPTKKSEQFNIVAGNELINFKTSDYGNGDIDEVIVTVNADPAGSADEALSSAKSYADKKVADLVGSAPTTLDTLEEVATAIKVHQSVTDALDAAIGNKANKTDLTSHTGNKSNPHGVTKSQVGLGNVPNVTTNNQTPTYSDATTFETLKSGETLAVALGKIKLAITNLIAHIANKSNPHGVTKAQVGLENVDNTSDVNKPISTAVQTALNGKANSSHGTHVSYSSTAPAMDGTAAVGTASTVARSDHKHPTDTSRASQTDLNSHTENTTVHVTAAERANWDSAKVHANSAHNYAGSSTSGGSANSAVKLDKARKISLGTAASGSTTFDGSSDITIPVNEVKEAYISWGGKNFSGSYGVLDAAMIPDLGANRFAFGKPEGIKVEYSRDGGTTWVDYGCTDGQKKRIFSTGDIIPIGKADGNNQATSDYMLRITVDTDAFNVYTILNKFAIEVSTNGSTGCYCTIDASLEATPTTFKTFADKIPVSGWSGWNIINTPILVTYGNVRDSQYGLIRFTFGCTGRTGNYNGLNIMRIKAFGGVGWSVPSNMARYGTIYSYDYNQSVTFPAEVTATKFIGAFSGDLKGTASQVAIYASGSDRMRPVPFATSSDAPGIFSYNTNFQYNPATQMLTSNISGNAATATKATQDASGNVITSTYATKTELSNNVSTLNTAISGKAAANHTHSSYVNQNAFSGIYAVSSKTEYPAPFQSSTLEFVQHDGTAVFADGNGKNGDVCLHLSNTGVVSVDTGSANGTLSITFGGAYGTSQSKTTKDIAVKGLGSAAYAELDTINHAIAQKTQIQLITWEAND